MRCPKCHYLSFEPEARCRNCGYDLALAEDDLIIKAVDDEDEGPLQDFALYEPGRAEAPAPITLGPLHHAVSEEPPVAVAPAPVPVPRAVRPPSTTTELPLFMRASAFAEADVEPPFVPMPAPRPPLAVRRRPVEAPTEPARFERTSVHDVAANLESVWAPLPPMPVVDPEPAEAHTPPGSSEWRSRAEPAERPEWPDRFEQIDVTPRARLMAAALDLVLLGGIDVVVLLLTLRICGLTSGELLQLPALPIVGFFGLMAAGYLILFTATSGQTLGKMATHIRVVDSADEFEPLSFRQAAVRSIAAVPSVIVLGAGFLPALGTAGLALHDRIAHTRVVRA